MSPQPSTWCFETGSLNKSGALRLGQAGWLASPTDLPGFVSLVLGSQACISKPGFFMWVLGIKSQVLMLTD